MRYLVTGGAGFLGSHLVERLLAGGDEVTCVDNLLTGRREHVEMFADNPRYQFIEHNISLPLFVDRPVDVVMHLASPASPVDYLEHPIPTLKVGALGTHHTLGIAKLNKATYFLASTSEVYGDPQIHPQPEGYWGHVNPIGPRGVYDEAKRYAEAMTMAYHREHALDTRIVRIFNSILADEQVLYDDGTELRREPIGDLAARLRGRIDLQGYSVPSFDRAGRIEPSEATALVGHAPAGPCYEVRTRYGRSIRVTGDHSVFVKGPDGPEARPVSQLITDDKIAIAARIDVPERDRPWVSVVEAWEAAGRDPWDLLVVAPDLGALAWERRFDLFGAMAATGKWHGAKKWRSAIWGKIHGMRERNSVPLAGLRAIGAAVPDEAWVLPRTAGKSSPLPARIQITDELLWFLGLYVAEGCWQDRPTKTAFITLSCEEETLERAAKIVQRDLALHVVKTPYGGPQRGASITIHSTLLLCVMDQMGFGKGAKRIPGWILGLPLSRLKWFLEGYREGDGVHSGKMMAEGIRHEFSTTSDELKDDLVVAFARFGLLPSVGRSSTNKPRSGDKRFPFWRLTLAKVAPWDMLDWDRGVVQTIQSPRTGDIVWAQVRSIQAVAATDLVYDFCVPGKENFWAGTGVMAHNTYGPRMRPTDGRAVSNFIVQALRNEPITVHGDGSQTRSFCYVTDLIEGFVRLVRSGEHQPVNIGNPEEYRVIELARMIVEIAESKSDIIFTQRPVDDPNVRRPDITRAREVLGWEPSVPVREGLRRTIEYFRTLNV